MQCTDTTAAVAADDGLGITLQQKGAFGAELHQDLPHSGCQQLPGSCFHLLVRFRGQPWGAGAQGVKT